MTEYGVSNLYDVDVKFIVNVPNEKYVYFKKFILNGTAKN